MGWDDKPPTADELKSLPAAHQGWDSAPPTAAELGAGSSDQAPISKLESYGRGASQTASLGFQDEISPTFERLFAKIFGDQATKDYYDTKTYKDLRDTYRGQNQAAQKANPWSYLGGQVTGMAPISIATGGSAAPEASGAAKFLSSLPGQFASGGATSAANAVGESYESDPTKLAGIAAKAGLIGGGTNLGLGLLNKGVGLGLSKAGNLADNLSDSFAIRSLGTRKKYIDQLVGKGKGQDLANLVRDEGIVTPFSSIDDIAEKVKNKFSQTGQAIGAIDTTADQFIQDLKTTNPQAYEDLVTRASGLGKNLRSEVVDPISQQMGRRGDANLLDNYLANEVDSFGGKELPLSELRDFKGNIRNKVNYYGNALSKDSGSQTAFSDLSNAVENKIQGTLNKIDQNYGTGTMGAEYQTLKDRYGLLAEGLNLSQDKLGRVQANRFMSPTDYIMGIGGYELGKNPIDAAAKGLTGVALNKFGKAYGNQIATTVFDKMGTVLSKTPEVLGPYATILQRAAANGPSDLAVSHYVLQQTDPEYRKKMDELEKSGTP